MAHMQPQITDKQRGWKVETHDAGTCYVPADVVSADPIFATAQPFARVDDADLFELLSKRLAAYVEGRDIEEIVVVEGYFFRLSAPGYLDCTAWDWRPTLKEAREALKEMNE